MTNRMVGRLAYKEQVNSKKRRGDKGKLDKSMPKQDKHTDKCLTCTEEVCQLDYKCKCDLLGGKR